jgi:hypothetical protein
MPEHTTSHSIGKVDKLAGWVKLEISAMLALAETNN